MVSFQQRIDITNSPEFIPKEHLSRLLDPSDIALYATLTNKFLIELKAYVDQDDDLSYCSVFEPLLEGYRITETERIELSLRKHGERATRGYRNRRGAKRYTYEKEFIILHLKKDEVTSLKPSFKEERFMLNLRAETLLSELQTEKEENYKLKGENQALKDYIQRLKDSNVTENRGGTIDEVKRTQTYYKLKELKGKTEAALWFVESYGLKIDKILLDGKNGKTILDFHESGHSYKNLSGEQREEVKKLVGLLDQYNISDDAYHELSMFYEGQVMRSYLIKECRENVDQITHIERTPGPHPGAQVSLQEGLNLLIRQEVQEKETENSTPNNHLKIRIGADGTLVSRVTNYIVLNLSMLGESSHKNYHTISVVEGSETYDTLKVSFSTLFGEINEQIDRYGNGNIPYLFNGQAYTIEYFLCGDMKILLILCGLKAANSEYACLYCISSRANRKNLQFGETHWEQKCKRRPLGKLGKYCQAHPPLLHIDLNHIMIDELHVLLRVGGILIRNLIMDAHRLDERASLLGRKKVTSAMDNLVAMIRSCGVAFKVWDTKDKSLGLDYTSCTGNQMKALFKLLPDKIRQSELISKPDLVANLWESFKAIYDLLSGPVLERSSTQTYFQKASVWMNKFVKLSKHLEGYDSVTPYMHILVYHVPRILREHGTLRWFSGQGLEKVNDDIKQTYHRKTNKRNAPEAALRCKRRKLVLKHHSRVPRKYTKRR